MKLKLIRKQSPESLLEAALDYARRGWPVFPIHSPTPDGQCDCGKSDCDAKHPWTFNGFKAATTDKDQIRAWWAEHPRANIGMATGERSGVFALDIDIDSGNPDAGEPPIDGYASLHDLTNCHGKLPKTPKMRTGRGGEQRFFRYPDTRISNSAGKVGHGLDIRGDGGYVLLPPSRSVYGSYSWLRSPDQKSFASAPDWLIARANGDNHSGTMAHASTPLPEAIQKGERNVDLFKAASSMRSKGFSEGAIFAALREESAAKCTPSMDDAELRKIAHSSMRYPPGTSGNKFKPKILANEICQKHDFICSPIDSSGKGVRLHIYRDGVFRANGEDIARRLADTLLGEDSTPARIDAIVDLIKEITKVEPSELDKEALRLLNLDNGMLDWRTGKLLKHSPKYRSTLRINAAFKPNLKSKWLDQFMQEVFPKDALKLAEEIVGYLLIPDTRQQKAFVLTGAGANGKSTFLGMTTALIGPANVANIALQDLSDSRYRAAELLGKLVNIYADIPNSRLEKSDIFKGIVGGDTITVERKFGHPFKLPPMTRLLFSANELPRTSDTTFAFFRRFVIIPFPNKFEGSKANKDLLRRLTTPIARSALLNRAIEGLRRLESNQQFTACNSVAEAGEQYRILCDSAYEFICEKLEATSDASHCLGKKVAYEVYANNWCKENGIRYPVSTTVFNKRLKEKLGVVEGLDRSQPKHAPRVWKGLRWKQGPDSDANLEAEKAASANLKPKNHDQEHEGEESGEKPLNPLQRPPKLKLRLRRGGAQ